MNRNDDYPMHRSPRCTAHSKRTGDPCRNPAVRGWRVCRMHGARSGSKAGPDANAFRHGMRTAKVASERRAMNELLRLCRQNTES